MREPRAILLRETPNAAPTGARVIDTSFEIVGRRRGFFGHVWAARVAIFWAAVVGLLIPPAWLIVERLLGN
jgi:hypothetical protein